jgi:hypothetical protein
VYSILSLQIQTFLFSPFYVQFANHSKLNNKGNSTLTLSYLNSSKVESSPKAWQHEVLGESRVIPFAVRQLGWPVNKTCRLVKKS